MAYEVIKGYGLYIIKVLKLMFFKITWLNEQSDIYWVV